MVRPTHREQYVADPERFKAHVYLNRAVRRGTITKPTECSSCGSTTRRIEGHHPSYAREDWLKVVWLCRSCHMALHKRGNPPHL